MPQETLIADYRVIDVWARKGMMCGRDSKEREQRSGGTSTVCFYLLGARHHQAQQAAFPYGHLSRTSPSGMFTTRRSIYVLNWHMLVSQRAAGQ